VNYQRALSLHPDNPSLSAFVQSLRAEIDAARQPVKKDDSKDDKETTWRQVSGLSTAHFELNPSAGIALETVGSDMGFGAGLGGFYMFDNEFGLGGMAHLYVFSSPNETTTSLEFVPAVKYKAYGEGIRPYLVAGMGLVLLADTSNTTVVGSISNTSYAPSQIFPILEGGAGLEYPVKQDLSVFLEARVDVILGNYGTASYVPVEAGLNFTL
jgi:hypothetical protein